MSALVHCIYTSVQTNPLSEAEVARLVQESRINNIQHGVTGILLHVNDTFFQVLEGSKEVVEALYAKILEDPRHKRVTRIIFETISRRYFGDSDMNIATMTRTELATVLGEENMAKRELILAELDEGRAKRLLRAFTDGRWRTHVGAPGVSSPAVRP